MDKKDKIMEILMFIILALIGAFIGLIIVGGYLATI